MISLELIKLLLVFLVILVLLWLKRPLWQAIACSILLSFFIFQIPAFRICSILWRAVFSMSTGTILLSFYTITFLQRMLEKRNLLMTAESSLNHLFHNRRITTILAPIFIGLLPSAGAVYICGSIVDSSCGDYLSKEDKTFVTSYYRHIPESFLPTYSSILIALGLAGVETGDFLLSMLPAVGILIFLGYIFYLRKIPREITNDEGMSKKAAFGQLSNSLWTIAAAIILIIAFHLEVYIATPLVIAAAFFFYRFSIAEIKPFFLSALEPKIIVNTLLIMIFKEVLTYTDVISQLPDLFSALPIPTYLAFALIFFFGSIIGGSTAIIVLCLPLAFAAIPNGGAALMMLLMSSSYCAMQVSPTHVCLALVTEYFHTGMGDLLKRTLPVILIFFFLVLLYYRVLTALILI